MKIDWARFLNLYFVYDVEIFKNFFCVSFKSEKNTVIFEFSERQQLDVENYLKVLSQLKNRFGVGFNSIGYDNLILNKSVEILQRNPHVNYLEFCTELKDFSDIIIYGQNLSFLKEIKKQNKETQLKLEFEIEEAETFLKKHKYNHSEEEWFEIVRPYRYGHTWEDVDLLLFWSKGLRLTKQLSLKSIACQLNYPVIQELPIAHDSLVQLEDIPNIITYNSVHDLGITHLLMLNLKEPIELRLSIRTPEFQCMSWDAPKIASETLLRSYAETKYGSNDRETLNTIRDFRFEKETFQFGDYLPQVKFETPLFQTMYEVCKNSVNKFSYRMLIPYEKYPLMIDYGVGGIHNSFENQVFKSDEKWMIYTTDVASLYPRLIELLKAFRFPEVLESYLEKKQYRLTVSKPLLKAAKKSGDSKALSEAKNTDEFYKLILNGVSKRIK